jgi:glutathione S-transferase
MKLYGGKVSPFVMRPVLVARAKGAALEPEPFEPGIKSEAYLAMWPAGKMPLLVDGDFHLPESQVIAEYLDAALPGPKLTPADPKAAAEIRRLTRITDLYVVPHLLTLFRGGDTAAAKAGIAEGLGYLEHYRRAGDSFAYGDSFTLADAAMIPVFFFLDAMEANHGTAALIAEKPGLAAWWARAKASELGGRCVAEQGEGLRAMMAARAAAAAAPAAAA